MGPINKSLLKYSTLKEIHIPILNIAWHQGIAQMHIQSATFRLNIGVLDQITSMMLITITGKNAFLLFFT